MLIFYVNILMRVNNVFNIIIILILLNIAIIVYLIYSKEKFSICENIGKALSVEDSFNDINKGWCAISTNSGPKKLKGKTIDDINKCYDGKIKHDDNNNLYETENKCS